VIRFVNDPRFVPYLHSWREEALALLVAALAADRDGDTATRDSCLRRAAGRLRWLTLDFDAAYLERLIGRP
jgi:hypothetical protein